jgi:hypothetical protein
MIEKALAAEVSNSARIGGETPHLILATYVDALPLL